MKNASLLFVLPLLVLAAPVAADPEPQQSGSAEAAKPEKDPDRVICRTQEEIGSRLRKKKVCMTAAQWREVNYQSGQATERKSTQIGRPGG